MLAVRRSRIPPRVPAVSAILVDEFEHDATFVAIPRPEIQLVVRFGPSARHGLDVHAFGPRRKAHRKTIRGGQRTVTARLQLGASEAALGVPASELAARIVPLDELWGAATARLLLDRLSAASTTIEAAQVVDSAIAERIAATASPRWSVALEAAGRLASTNVNLVADELGVSERHLRRVFRKAIGVSPKEFSKLARFHRALRAACADRTTSWARIATASGYYDQAHLIAEFRAITGVTPQALLVELGENAAPPHRSLARSP